MKKLSIIIPCYNEEKNLPLLFNRCNEIMLRNDIEIIFVDNGSTDNTPSILKELLNLHPFIRSIRIEINQGYGHGILVGLANAKGTVLSWTHADLQTDPNDVISALNLFEKTPNNNMHFLKGKRFGRPFVDNVFTIGMSFFETILMRKPMWDINAQPTMFSRQFYESWINPPKDFSLDLYVYYFAIFKQLKITRFPVQFGKRAHGISHWNFSMSSKYKFIKRTFTYSFSLARRIK